MSIAERIHDLYEAYINPEGMELARRQYSTICVYSQNQNPSLESAIADFESHILKEEYRQDRNILIGFAAFVLGALLYHADQNMFAEVSKIELYHYAAQIGAYVFGAIGSVHFIRSISLISKIGDLEKKVDKIKEKSSSDIVL